MFAVTGVYNHTSLKAEREREREREREEEEEEKEEELKEEETEELLPGSSANAFNFT